MIRLSLNFLIIRYIWLSRVQCKLPCWNIILFSNKSRAILLSIYDAKEVNGNGVWKWKCNVNGVCLKFESIYVEAIIGIYPSKYIWCIVKHFEMTIRRTKIMHRNRKVEMQWRSCYWDYSILQSTPNWNVTIINSGWLKCCILLLDYVHFILLKLKQLNNILPTIELFEEIIQNVQILNWKYVSVNADFICILVSYGILFWKPPSSATDILIIAWSMKDIRMTFYSEDKELSLAPEEKWDDDFIEFFHQNGIWQVKQKHRTYFNLN